MVGGTTIGKGKDREKRTIEEIEIEVMKESTDGNLPTMRGEVEIIGIIETETAETTETIVVLATTVTQESSDTSLETRDITDPSTRIDWSIHK